MAATLGHGDVIVRRRKLDRRPGLEGWKLLCGGCPNLAGRRDPQGFGKLASFLLLTALLLFLPLSLLAQSSSETEALKAFQAAKEAQAKGDYAAAVKGYQAVLKLMPNTAEVYSDLGLAYYLNHQYAKAIAALEEARKLKPSLLGPNLFLGMAYIRTSQFEKSIPPLKKAIAMNPKLREAYVNLAGSYDSLGRSQEALQVLLRAQKRWPNDVEVLYSLGTLYYHLMFSTYGRMATVAPNSYRYDQVLGKSFEEREEYPEAIVEFQKALKKKPDSPSLHYALGNVYWLSGQNDKAIVQFKAELEMSPQDAVATWKLGNIYLQKREFDKALPYLKKAVKMSPDLGQAFVDLGKLYMQTHRPKEALPYFQKAVQMDPDEPDPRYQLAMAYRSLGNMAEAQTQMKMFQKLKSAQTERRTPPTAMKEVPDRGIRGPRHTEETHPVH